MVTFILVFLQFCSAIGLAHDWWSAPEDLGGVNLTSAPSSVAGGFHKLDVFYCGPNNHLWMSFWNGGPWWSAPEDLGGVRLTSPPTAVAGGFHKLDVFYRGLNNHLWMSWWDGGQWWSAPEDLGGVKLTSAPAAVVGGFHKLDVFYRGPNNHLWMSWWDGGQWWSAPEDLGGVNLTSAPAAVAGGFHKLDVFYRGPNNHLWMSWWDGGQWWSAPEDLGGEELRSGPAASANSQHKVDVFYKGPNDHLWTSFYDGGAWWSAPIDLGGVSLTSEVGTSSFAYHKLDVFYRGPNNHLWTSWWPSEVWYDAFTGAIDLSPKGYDLVTRRFDDNGIALNPMHGSQTWTPSRLADPSLCGYWYPWTSSCTKQPTWIDKSWICTLAGGLGGHANWGLATYTGTLYWHDHSSYLLDDDYSIALYRDDLAGVTQKDLDGRTYLHCEFNSDQTINGFHTWYWENLHHAVDSDGGKGGSYHDLWYATRPLVDGKEAIVMGLFGLDCAHDCTSELHPVFAMAVHLSPDDTLDDDTWAIFVRNWGDEGFCSSGQERINPSQPFTFTFRFPKPGAIAVNAIMASNSDTAGKDGTIFYMDHRSTETNWQYPQLVKGEGATVTFSLPSSNDGQKINGMLHLRWLVSAKEQQAQQSLAYNGYARASLFGRPPSRPPSDSTISDEPESLLESQFLRLSESQKVELLKRARGIKGTPSKNRPVICKPIAHRPVSRRFTHKRKIKIVHSTDRSRDLRDMRVHNLLDSFGIREPGTSRLRKVKVPRVSHKPTSQRRK